MNPADPAPGQQGVPAQQEGTGIPDRAAPETPVSGRGQPFTKLAREIQQEDLTHPAVARLVLNMLDKAEDECSELRRFRTQLHEEKAQSAVLKEKLKGKTALDIVCAACFGVGGIVVGLSTFFWTVSWEAGLIALCVGVILMGGSTIAQVKGN